MSNKFRVLVIIVLITTLVGCSTNLQGKVNDDNDLLGFLNASSDSTFESDNKNIHVDELKAAIEESKFVAEIPPNPYAYTMKMNNGPSSFYFETCFGLDYLCVYEIINKAQVGEFLLIKNPRLAKLLNEKTTKLQNDIDKVTKVVIDNKSKKITLSGDQLKDFAQELKYAVSCSKVNSYEYNLTIYTDTRIFKGKYSLNGFIAFNNTYFRLNDVTGAGIIELIRNEF